jgi:KDO2-lipid IV(A) lauroyltransferase
MGSKLLYYLVIKPISLCPYWILYGISDFFFLVLYYLVGYRKKVVTDNISKCFPEKSFQEVLSIRRKFYRHFCDLVIESLKNFSINRKQAMDRMNIVNPELVDKWVKERGGVILCTGHYGNWELWATAAMYFHRLPVLGIYKRLSNPFFDAKMRETRSKNGLLLVSTRETGTYLRTHINNPKSIAFAFDQSPANPEKCVWIEFMKRETAAYFGAEKYAKEFNYPLIYGSIDKTSRGHYKGTYSMICENPQDQEHGKITKMLHDELEKHIRLNPEYYLWSHRRWKHKPPRA